MFYIATGCSYNDRARRPTKSHSLGTSPTIYSTQFFRALICVGLMEISLTPSLASTMAAQCRGAHSQQLGGGGGGGGGGG